MVFFLHVGRSHTILIDGRNNVSRSIYKNSGKLWLGGKGIVEKCAFTKRFQHRCRYINLSHFLF